MENHKLFTLIIVCYICFQIVSPIYIQNNAYKGISISISESVKERDFDFQKLKAVLSKSSDFIYYATRKRSYLGEFLISLPSSWNKELQKCSSSEVIEDFRRVDVHLTDSKGGLKTKHSRGCGKEGDRIYMSMDWLNGKQKISLINLPNNGQFIDMEFSKRNQLKATRVTNMKILGHPLVVITSKSILRYHLKLVFRHVRCLVTSLEKKN
ncbi:hypothetical protein CEXT_200521 [Caerostris extrusa]|uniref:Calcium-activated chloride channel N-terminal domain-containing protein n=1 Tax=Caerostris extrusa TaxID=172846 RepID=A0AAV4N2E8_CAEEX|nr:hypothetical protein CEXT_200521 [Caerostris extrusa]